MVINNTYKKSKRMPRKNYVNVGIPSDLIKLVDKALKDGCGYSGRAEWVRQAIREKLDKEK